MRKWQPAVLLTALLLITIATLRYGNPSHRQEPGAGLSVFPAAANSGQNASASPDGIPGDPSEPVEPSSIDLADLPADLPRAENKYDLWLRGELGEGKEGLIGEEERARLEEAALLLEPSPNIQNPATGTDSSGLEITVAFDGPDIDDCCGGGGGAVPPDPELAVGLDHVIAVVNYAFQIYDKTGVTLHGPTTFAALFSNVPGCTSGTLLFDPNVLYDEAADRYVLGIVGGGDYYCLAASATSDPTGVWHRYRFPTTQLGGGSFDYPHAGVGRDAIYMGGNMFYCSTCAFKDARIWAFDKWAIYAAQSAAWRERVLPDSDDTPQPANLHGYAQDRWPSDEPHYFITEYLYDGKTYSVWAWNDPFGSNSLYTPGTFDLVSATGVSAGLPPPAPQPSYPLDTITANDWRPQDAEYRNGYIWTTNTIACNPGTGSVDCVRWAQVEPESATVVQAGVIAGNGQYRLFGDLAVNHCNEMALGYTKTNPGDFASGFPGIWVAGRHEEDTANMLRSETPLKLSNVPYQAFDSPPRRWGDYTGFTSDPDGLDVWYIGQYSKNADSPSARWGTFIGRFRFVPDVLSSPPPSPSPSLGLGYDFFLPFVVNPYIEPDICDR
jgi:hypothetical protein